MSLLGALTPLGKGSSKLWFRCVSAYTVSGALSAAVVGIFIGFVGLSLSRIWKDQQIFLLVIVLSLVLALRDWEWVRFSLLERKCQTEQHFAHEFGFVIASAMWGFHIGLGFATRITYGGFWVLVAIGLSSASVKYAALLMVVYWLGRSLPVWIAPALWDGCDTRILVNEVIEDGPVCAAIDGFTLLWAAGNAFLLAFPQFADAGFLR